MPPPLWAAFGLAPREGGPAVVALSGVAIAGTLRGLGPFARPAYNESLLLLQAFMGVTAVMTLVLAAVGAGRKEAVGPLRPLAGSHSRNRLAHLPPPVAALTPPLQRAP